MEKLIIFMIFVGFSIVSSIAKSAKEKREREQALERRRAANVGGAPRAEARPKPKKKSVQTEIESFLNEVSEGRATPQGDEEAKRREKAEAKRRKQEAARQRQLQIAERKRQQQQAEQRRSKRPSEQRRSEREKKSVSSVTQSVEAHLGRRSVEMPRSTVKTSGRKASSEIFAMLQDTQGVRNAIIVNEILNRPKSLRD